MLSAKKGHVVTICSTASFMSGAKINAYSATKAAALSFHEGMETLPSQLKPWTP